MNRIDALDHVPPHDEGAENAVIGCLLLDPAAGYLVAGFLKPEHFYKPGPRECYAAALDVIAQGSVPDAVTLLIELRRRGTLEVIGGEEAISKYVQGVPSAGNTEHYARKVTDYAAKRAILTVSMEMRRVVYDNPDAPAGDVVDRAERMFMETVARRSGSTVSHISEVVDAELRRLDEGKAVGSIYSHLGDLDRATNGFENGTLTILAARPSMGKSSLATGIVRENASRGIPGVFFSLEVPKSQVVTNLIGQEARMNTLNIRRAPSEQEVDAFRYYAGQVRSWPIAIDDSGDLGIMQLRARARTAKNRYGARYVVLDYLQLLATSERGNRAEEVGKLSRGLKTLARELDVPVIALCQLNRAVEGRDEKRPRLADLRESGSLEQDADTVLFVFREHYYNPKACPSAAEVIVAKNRNGPAGVIVPLYWQKDYCRFFGAGSE